MAGRILIGSALMVLLTLAAVTSRATAQVVSVDQNVLDTTNNGLNPLVLVPLGGVVLALVGFMVVRSRPTDAMPTADPLTGLANRRRLDRDMQGVKAFGQTAVLMIDVDHFKILNDTHGHDFGEEVLRQVGAALATTFRKEDVPYRYSDEEFCVLLRDTTSSEALIAGERARRAIAAIRLPDDVRVTASIGVALTPGSVHVQTIEAADHALDQAKHNGRNRVEFSGH